MKTFFVFLIPILLCFGCLSARENRNNNGEIPYLQYGFGQGCLHVKEALITAPKKLRKHIIVVSLAPATCIDRKLCRRVVNYRSKWNQEVEPWFDLTEQNQGKEMVDKRMLNKDAKWIERELQSPPYEDAMRREFIKHQTAIGLI